MKELAELRQELDQLDREIVALFEQRMAVSRQVAQYKLTHGLPVLDRSREAQVIESRTAMLADASLSPALRTFFETVMALSRNAQEAYLREVRGDA
ncbi:MAG: chorismate mutase [Christensenellaceae bacterium]|nr:chorismate mutase [Christensenellaceae bacterium]